MGKIVQIESPSTDLEMGSYSKDSVIVTDDGVYKMELLPDLETVKELDETVAYIEGDTFYIYHGKLNGDRKFLMLRPGIYLSKENEYFIQEPKTEEELKEYSVKEHACTLNSVSIIDSANTKEEILVAIPESSKIFQPEITTHDDILKLCAKKALIVKQVDLDQYKDRFSNKNELFNLKQVIRGDNTLSMRIFIRFIEALNLKFTITLSERTENDIVGKPLKEDITVSSEETYAA